MALEGFSNYAVTTVSSGGTTAPAAGTVQSWTVASSAGFPPALSSATPPTLFHVADPAAPAETMLVTNVSGTTWTVTRGVENTAPVAHASGFTVQQVFSAGGAGMWPQWHNVRSVTYGAQGNGTTNDTTAIQAALTAAGSAGGGVVYLPPGTYLTGALTIPSNVTLLGSGPGCTILSAASGTTGTVLALAVAATTRWTQIRDLTVNCNSISGLTGVTLDNTGLSPSTPGFHRLFNVQVFDAGQDGFSFPSQIEMMAAFCLAFNAGRYGYNIATACTDSRFTSCTAGATGSHGFSVTSSNCHYVSCKAYYAGYNGSTFSTGHGWYVVGTSVYPVQGNTFTGCEAQDCAQQGWNFNPNGGTLLANAMTGCTIDSCNAAGGTGAAGVGIALDALIYCTVSGNNIWNRTSGAGTMTYGVSVTGTQTGTAIGPNSVDVTNAGIYYVSGSGYLLTEPYLYDLTGVSGYVKMPSLVAAPASPQALSNNTTITLNIAFGSIPLTATGNVTGIILAAAANSGQAVTLVNQSAFTVTFAAAGTSNVADGVSDVIPALTCRTFLWDGNTSLWYRAA